MNDEQKPNNGHDPNAAPTVDQPEPPDDVRLAKQRIAKFMVACQQAVAQTGAVSVPDIVADQQLHSHQIMTMLQMLFEPHGDQPPLLDWREYNRRLGEKCAAQTAELTKPKIAIAVGNALRPPKQ